MSRQKDKKTKDKKTKRQKDRKSKRQKDKKDKKRQKDNKQRPTRELNIATSGQFRTLAMFLNMHLYYI